MPTVKQEAIVSTILGQGMKDREAREVMVVLSLLNPGELQTLIRWLCDIRDIKMKKMRYDK